MRAGPAVLFAFLGALSAGVAWAEDPDAGTALDGGTMPSPARALIEATRPSERLDEPLQGGRHLRLGTDRGPVHVWVPPGYRASRAGIVVYAHGYTQNVDQVWGEHRLAWQFAGSRLNALFIVPEVPSARADEVTWKNLEGLLAVVRKRTRVSWPSGPMVAVGHSGAYRTLVEWLPHPRLKKVVLLDGLYGNELEFSRWMKAGAGSRQLVLVSIETVERANGLLKKLRRPALREEVPDSMSPWTGRERQAAVVGVETTRYDHFTLITSGEALPVLLQLVRP